ncbi:unnamed protein product, partial [Rotaria sp. Silwood1]
SKVNPRGLVIGAATTVIPYSAPGTQRGTIVEYGITVVAAPMTNPRGLTFDANGNMIVTDNNNHRIISFAMYCPPNVTTTTTLPTPQVTIPVCQTAAWNQSFTVLAGSSGNAGTSSILLYQPYSSFIDIYGNLYVVDRYNHRIQY